MQVWYLPALELLELQQLDALPVEFEPVQQLEPMVEQEQQENLKYLVTQHLQSLAMLEPESCLQNRSYNC